jgi:hypothetical protein
MGCLNIKISFTLFITSRDHIFNRKHSFQQKITGRLPVISQGIAGQGVLYGKPAVAYPPQGDKMSSAAKFLADIRG